MTSLTLLLLVTCVIGSSLITLRWLKSVKACLPHFGRETICLASPVVVLVFGVGLFGRLFENVDAALAATCILIALLGVWARGLPEAHDERSPLPTRERVFAGAALFCVVLLYSLTSAMYQMHDEFALFGHKSMVEQIRNGFFPPHLPPIPESFARYHYGFDILAGLLARGLGLSSDFAIDFVSVYLASLISLASAAIVAQGEPRYRNFGFAMIAVHLGSGLAWLLLWGVEGRHPRCLVQYHHPTCGVDPFYPMPLLNVFQHPVALGLALFLVLIVLSRAALMSKQEWKRFLVPSLLVCPALALGQIVYFALGLLAIVTALLIWFLGGRRDQIGERGKRLVVYTLVLIVGSGTAYFSGGMFTPSDVIQEGLVVRRTSFGFPENVGFVESYRQHLVTLGIGFLLLPFFGLVALIKRKWSVLVLVAFAHGGILVPHLWTYSRSWDIVKFPSAAAFALSLLFVIVLDGQTRMFHWLRVPLRGLLVVGGLMGAFYLLFTPEPDWRFYEKTNRQVDPLVGQTIDWWRDNGYQKEDVVYCQANISPMLSIFGGISVIGSDSDFHYLGVKAGILHLQSRHRRLIHKELNEQSLQALNVRWLMFSEEEVRNLGATAQKLLEGIPSNRFELVAEFKSDVPGKTRRIWKRKISK
ncbi:MAG: hypothetical protein VYC39_10155 [Myxococcota bacterium]|nr:hypothetical protein [Myxococcota bacterium]